ncbi:hypothetical protein MSG28_007413 [Choristoneura fumiferana]|uniref:Uncharacterized protein n=1 Tax=Choristoneura fumiferana TaxID=7141 RepID=A0ACC0JXN7_CHOFU|nr:hypothetical protein MSG28_007413 [Choristoneura fumiferana]
MSEKNPRVEEKPLNDRQFEYKSKSFYEKLCYIKSHITVEPIFAGLVIGSMLSRIATQNLNLDKACRVKKNFGDIICDSLIDRDGNYTSNEAEIQKVISEIETWRSVIQTAIPTVLVMFMERPFNCKGIGNDAERDDRGCYEKTRRQLQNKNILTLLVVALAYGPNHGEAKVLYLFLRYRLNWDALKYSIYSTESIIIHSLGALFTISVFSKRLGWDDSVLCLISIVSKLIGSIYIIFVRTDFHMYMVPIVEILNATTFTSLRSMASKLVPSAEMAGSLGNIVVTSNKIKLKRE